MNNRCSTCGCVYHTNKKPKCPVCEKTGVVFENKPHLGKKLLNGGYWVHDTRLAEEK